MTLDAIRKAVRPAMQVMLIVMIGPLAIAIGTIEAFVPGAGVRFANGALEWLRGLPSDFWLFAGVGLVGHQVTRTLDKKTEVAAAQAYADVLHETKAPGERDS